MNSNKLRGKMIEMGYSVEKLASKIGIDRATLYRKLKEESFNVREAVVISRELELTIDELMAIFFPTLSHVARHI